MSQAANASNLAVSFCTSRNRRASDSFRSALSSCSCFLSLPLSLKFTKESVCNFQRTYLVEFELGFQPGLVQFELGVQLSLQAGVRQLVKPA